MYIRARARYLRYRLEQLLRDARGVSATEFAIVAPLMLVIYVGALETGNALTIFRRTAQVASTAADLTAQVKTVTKGDIHDIQSAASSIISPYAAGPLKIVLTSVVANDQNQGKVQWSCSNKGGARAKDSNFQVPNGLTEPNTSVVVAEITYAFEPLLGLSQIFSPGSFDMKRTFYSRPRRSLQVKKEDQGC